MPQEERRKCTWTLNIKVTSFRGFATLNPWPGPWTPLGAEPPDSCYRLALRARHGLSKLSFLLCITKFFLKRALPTSVPMVIRATWTTIMTTTESDRSVTYSVTMMSWSFHRAAYLYFIPGYDDYRPAAGLMHINELKFSLQPDVGSWPPIPSIGHPAVHTVL